MFRLYTFLIFSFFWTAAQGQSEISGRVIDKDTDEGLPFCNVYYPGTTVGVATDIDGYFTIKSAELDSLSASAVGYRTVTKLIKRDRDNLFYLTSQSLELSEIVVLAGENPAIRIVQGILDNKPKNRLKEKYNYEVEKYSKVELDIDNINSEFRESKLLRPFDFIFENIDSTSDIKPFLPFYVTESISNVYYDKGDKSEKEILLAHKVSGINNSTVIEFIGSMYSDFEIYDNQFGILGKVFSAPFSDRAFLNYEYYLLDSTIIEDQKAYKLKFKPRRRSEKTMYGEFWVIDSTFSVQRLDMRMSEDVNINLVSRILYFQENRLENGDWVVAKKKLVVDFNAKEDAPGLIGRKTESFKKYQVDRVGSEDYSNKEVPERIDFDQLRKDDDFWKESRHETLSSTEEQVYSMVDSLKSMPVYQTYVDVINLFLTGYIDVGYVELGTAFGVYSFNQIEGHRPSLSIRTTTKFSKKIRLQLAAAYGFRDERLKPTVGVLWIPRKYPRREFEFRYKEAIDFSSTSSEDIVEGNLFANIYRRDIYQKLLHVRELKLGYEEFWNKGLSGRVSFLWRDLDPYGGLDAENNGFNYRYYTDPNSVDQFDTTIVSAEFNIKLRYAFKEKFIDGHFSRTSIGSRFPIVEMQYTRGLSGVFGSQYDYHKLTLAASHWFNISTLGWFKYNIKAGKVFSTVPFLLAEVHQGNETYFYSPNAYNSMNKYAFASDQFVSLRLQHHFDGFFLNRIPLLRKLQLREVVEFRAVWGSMNEENLKANAYNVFDRNTDFKKTYNGFQTLKDIPYMEVGIGVENILKILRFDVIYRLNYLEPQQASRLNIRAGFQFYL